MWQSVFVADTGVLLASENVTLSDRVCQMMSLWMFVVGRRCLPDDATATDCVCQKMSLWETVFFSRCHCDRLCLSDDVTVPDCACQQSVFVSRCHCDRLCLSDDVTVADCVCCQQWCFAGKCVEIGDRPQAINGEWGEWAGWTPCSRSCGAGVTHSERHCNHPP